MAESAKRTISPCDFKSLAGSVSFYYDPQDEKENCKNSTLAKHYVKTWKETPDKNQFSAADLNNAGCAHVWLERPDWKKAYELFGRASVQCQGKNETIEENRQEAKRKSSPPKPTVRRQPRVPPRRRRR